MGRAAMRRERRRADRPRSAEAIPLGGDGSVDNVWMTGRPAGVQRQDGGRGTAGQTSSRMAGGVVNSMPEDLCSGRAARPPPGRSSMADPALPPTPRILYIEDNPESRALVRSVLEPRGFDVLEAEDGMAGIDLAIASHPDLIGCDGYIETPIDVKKFPGQLRAFLKGKREKVKSQDERRYLREYSKSLVERLEATVRELTAANRRLRAAARAKTEFMQNLAHELATPLTPITGYLQILQSGKMGTLSEQKRILESMGLATDRLSRTIDNLVNFATFEGGGHAVHRKPFDLQALLKAVLEEERLKAKSRRIHLDVKVETLEQGFGDDRKLRQALSKLIDNSIKFGPHGSEILVRVSGDPTHLLFEVYDQGEGLLPGEGEKVFDPFFHADRVGEERAPGAGLGLPVAKQIIEAHGGKIWAESPPKNQPDSRHHFSGAKVAFWIPSRATAPAEPQPTPFPALAPEGGTS